MKLLGGLAIFWFVAFKTYDATFSVTSSMIAAFATWFIYWLLITMYYEW